MATPMTFVITGASRGLGLEMTRQARFLHPSLANYAEIVLAAAYEQLQYWCTTSKTCFLQPLPQPKCLHPIMTGTGVACRLGAEVRTSSRSDREIPREGFQAAGTCC